MHSTVTRRRGATLVELVASMVSAAALLGGISGTMFIALKASDPAYTPAAHTLEASACLADMAADLQFATAVTVAATTSITITAPDRSDADSAPETIQYSWTPTAGQPLTRRQNGGAWANVLPAAHAVAFGYYPDAASPQLISVQLQRTASGGSTVQTSIPLLNMP